MIKFSFAACKMNSSCEIFYLCVAHSAHDTVDHMITTSRVRFFDIFSANVISNIQIFHINKLQTSYKNAVINNFYFWKLVPYS